MLAHEAGVINMPMPGIYGDEETDLDPMTGQPAAAANPSGLDALLEGAGKEGEGVDTLTGQPMRPNVPRDPNDPREKLKSYLRDKLDSDKQMRTPEFRAADRAPREALMENNRDMALSKAMMQSANQIGTMGGKAASSEPFNELTGSLSQGNSQAMAGIQRDRAGIDQTDDRRLKIMQYLSDRAGKDDAVQGAMLKRKQDMDYRNSLLKLKADELAKSGITKAGDKDERKASQDRDFSFKLAKDYADDPTSKNTAVIRQSLERARKVAADPSPANDMSLVYSLMNANDPKSSVKEGEFNMGQNLGSVSQKILGLRQKVLDGTMNPTIRAGILKSIENLSSAQEKSQLDIDAQYDSQSKNWNINPDLIIGHRRSRYKEEPTVAGMAPGKKEKLSAASAPAKKDVNAMSAEELMQELGE